MWKKRIIEFLQKTINYIRGLLNMKVKYKRPDVPKEEVNELNDDLLQILYDKLRSKKIDQEHFQYFLLKKFGMKISGYSASYICQVLREKEVDVTYSEFKSIIQEEYDKRRKYNMEYSWKTIDVAFKDEG